LEHITEIAWADYVRHVSSPAAVSLIQHHLAGGCASCRNAAALWQSLAEVAQQEAHYEPPAEMVHLVKSQFAAAQMAAPARALLATLTFDSFASGMPAGIRSSGPSARQLLYEVDGLTIDLRIDKHAASKALSIVGQVLDARTLRLAHEAVPVALLDRHGKPVQRTATTSFGEFHLEVAADTDLQLAIEVDGNRSVCIPLPCAGCDPHSDFGEQNRLRGRGTNDYSGK
jgi:hypothetical protein